MPNRITDLLGYCLSLKYTLLLLTYHYYYYYFCCRELEHIQQKIVAVCQNRVSSHGHVIYEVILRFLKLYSLQDRRIYLEAVVLISVYFGLKGSPFFILLEFPVLPQNFSNSSSTECV
jgi:hypothetical protein